MVIQRWQSVLLLIATIMMGCFSFFSLGQIQTSEVSYNLTTLGFTPEGIPTGTTKPEGISTWYFFIVSIISSLLPLIAIFTYKQMKLQKNLCIWTALLIACCINIGVMLANMVIDGGIVSWSSWICAPFIAFIAVIMAYVRINADWKKIRSAERFR